PNGRAGSSPALGTTATPTLCDDDSAFTPQNRSFSGFLRRMIVTEAAPVFHFPVSLLRNIQRSMACFSNLASSFAFSLND
ncbi:MAG: hypothetical protein WBV71_11060, partial [Roseobacter sp.]